MISTLKTVSFLTEPLVGFRKLLDFLSVEIILFINLRRPTYYIPVP